jgi:hypothetical protein
MAAFCAYGHEPSCLINGGHFSTMWVTQLVLILRIYKIHLTFFSLSSHPVGFDFSTGDILLSTFCCDMKAVLYWMTFTNIRRRIGSPLSLNVRCRVCEQSWVIRNQKRSLQICTSLNEDEHSIYSTAVRDVTRATGMRLQRVHSKLVCSYRILGFHGDLNIFVAVISNNIRLSSISYPLTGITLFVEMVFALVSCILVDSDHTVIQSVHLNASYITPFCIYSRSIIPDTLRLLGYLVRI